MLKAGKLNLEGKKLVPDPRKGLLQVVVLEGVPHVQWKPRDGNAELDFYSSNKEQQLRLEMIPSTRACLLKTGDKKTAFFWIQEPTTESSLDLQRISELNTKLIIVDSQSQQQPEPKRQAIIDVNALKAIMRQLSDPNATSEDDGDVDLTDVLKPSEVISIIKEHPPMKQLLISFCPDEMKTETDLEEILHSPQFRQAVEVFEIAIKQAEATQILIELGLDPSAQGSFGGMRRFLQAMISKYKKPLK